MDNIKNLKNSELLSILSWFDRNPGQQKYEDKNLRDFQKEAIIRARGLLAKGTIDDRDTDTARQVIEKSVKIDTKITPPSQEIKQIIAKATSAGVESEDQKLKLENSLKKAQRQEVVLTQERVRQSMIDANIRQGIYDEVIKSLPQEPFLVTQTPETLSTSTGTLFTAGSNDENKSIDAAQSAATAVAAGTIGKSISTAIGAAGGPAGLVVSTVASQAANFVASHAKDIKKLALISLPIFAGGFATAFAGLGIAPGAAAGLGVGLAASSAGGFSGTMANIGNLAGAALAGIGAATVGAFAVPFIIGVVATPILIAIILFIINSGAYITPPSSSLLPGAVVSPYVDITKLANPSCINKTGCPGFGEVKYSVKIHAKQGSLLNLKISNQYAVSGKTGVNVPNPDIPELRNPPTTLDPTKDFTFNYSVTIGQDLNNSILIDTITVNAQTTDGKEAVAAASASVIIGNPKIDCPLPGGQVVWGSYTPGNENAGHGSNAYWNSVGRTCSYPLPQTAANCFAPSSSPTNVCSQQGKPSCPFYGYAADVFPRGTTEIFAPTVNGQDLEWTYNGVNFPNGGGANGYSYGYTDSTGKYSILFTHIRNNPSTTGNIASGQKIGDLYPQGGNTHLHLEFQIDGVYQKPENYFCR